MPGVPYSLQHPTIKLILKEFDEYGPCTRDRLIQVTSLSRSQVSRALQFLRKKKKIYIDSYGFVPSGRRLYPIRVYALGNKPDYIYPALSEIERWRRSKERRKLGTFAGLIDIRASSVTAGKTS